jgi:hypothetical protein
MINYENNQYIQRKQNRLKNQDQAQVCSLLSHNLVPKKCMFMFLYLYKILKDFQMFQDKKMFPMLYQGMPIIGLNQQSFMIILKPVDG